MGIHWNIVIYFVQILEALLQKFVVLRLKMNALIMKKIFMIHLKNSHHESSLIFFINTCD